MPLPPAAVTSSQKVLWDRLVLALSMYTAVAVPVIGGLLGRDHTPAAMHGADVEIVAQLRTLRSCRARGMLRALESPPLLPNGPLQPVAAPPPHMDMDMHMAHGTWHMAHGTWTWTWTWHMAHGTWHMAHGTWHMAHGTWHMDMDMGLIMCGLLTTCIAAHIRLGVMWAIDALFLFVDIPVAAHTAFVSRGGNLVLELTQIRARYARTWRAVPRRKQSSRPDRCAPHMAPRRSPLLAKGRARSRARQSPPLGCPPPKAAPAVAVPPSFRTRGLTCGVACIPHHPHHRRAPHSLHHIITSSSSLDLRPQARRRSAREPAVGRGLPRRRRRRSVGLAAWSEWSEWPPWRRHGWPPEAHETASEGLRRLYALGRTDPAPQTAQSRRHSDATPRHAQVADDFAAFDPPGLALRARAAAAPSEQSLPPPRRVRDAPRQRPSGWCPPPSHHRAPQRWWCAPSPQNCRYVMRFGNTAHENLRRVASLMLGLARRGARLGPWTGRLAQSTLLLLMRLRPRPRRNSCCCATCSAACSACSTASRLPSCSRATRRSSTTAATT